MAITLGTEVALPLHLDTAATYTDLEDAVTGAGFTNYTIMRQVNSDGSGDAQLFVRGEISEEGIPDDLVAADTLTQLAAAITALAGGA
jgi:hypothetical protein